MLCRIVPRRHRTRGRRDDVRDDSRYRGRRVALTFSEGRDLRPSRRPRHRVGYFKLSPPPGYLTMAALSGYTSLAPSTLRKLMQNSRDPLPSFTVGRRRLFSKQSVDQWMARREAQEQAGHDALENLRLRKGHVRVAQ